MRTRKLLVLGIVALGFLTTLSAYALPDILPQNISLSGTSVAAGGTLTVTFDILNQGTTSAVATTTRLRLNQSSTATSISDTSLGDVSTPSIVAGGVASGLNKVVTIPSGTPAGTYYIWVIADNGSVLTQSNYANDYAHSVAFTVTVTAALPDVLPQNISLSSSSAVAGGTLTVTFDIRNQGSGNAAATTTRLRLNQSSTATSTSDTSLGDVSTPSISAGSVASGLNKIVTIPSGTPAGTYYIWVVADNGSVLTQSNYGNDYAHSLSFTVTAAQPDVLPQNISLSSSTVTAGGTLTVTFDIRNQGSGNAAATTTRLRLNQSSTTTSTSDTSLGDVSTPAISAGSVASGLNKIVTIPNGTPAGTYYIWVVADNGNVLTQLNYGNDYAHSLSFTVTAPQPDVLPQNISLSSSSVVAGGTLTVTFDIHNQGSGDAAATTTRLRLNQSSTTTSTSDTSLGDVSTPAISAGSVASGLNKIVTIPSGTPAGTYYIWVVADNGSVLTQSNYGNDYAHSLSFTVTATQSDILPQNVSLSSSTVTAGGTLTVTFDIRNQGSGDAAATTTRLRLNQSTTTTSTSDTSLGDVSTPAISAGAVASGLSKVVTIPSGIPAGTYYIWVVADNGSVLNQSNVANDYAHSSALTVAVTPVQSDILPQNITLNSSSVASGGTLTVTFDIRNQGSGDAIATTTRLRLNQSTTGTTTSDISLGDVSTPAIAAGGVASGLNKVVTIPSGTASGTFYIWVVADNGSVLSQSNVNNDYGRSTALTITGNTVPANSLFTGTVEWIHYLPDAINAANLASAGTVIDTGSLLDFLKGKGFKGVIIKGGQGMHMYPASAPFSSSIVNLCHQKGLKVYGYQYVYGGAYDPVYGEYTTVSGEVTIANQILGTGCDGLIIDWETEFQKVTDAGGNPTVNDSGAAAAAHAALYCQGIRNAYPNAFLAHAPIWNPVLNWPAIYKAFNQYCDAAMPQAYCAVGSTASAVANSTGATMAANMNNAWNQAQADWPSGAIKPICPVLWAYSVGAPNPTQLSLPNSSTSTTAAQILDFVNTIKNFATPASPGGYQGVSFWACELHTASLWNGLSGITIGNSGSGASSPTISSPTFTAGNFTLTTPSQVGYNYVLEFKNSMSDPSWIPVQTNSGNGGTIGLTNNGVVSPSRFYRIGVQ